VQKRQLFEDRYVKKTLLGIIALALVAVFGNGAVAVAAGMPAAGHKTEHRIEHKKAVHKRIVRRRIVHRRIAKKFVHKKHMVRKAK